MQDRKNTTIFYKNTKIHGVTVYKKAFSDENIAKFWKCVEPKILVLTILHISPLHYVYFLALSKKK